VHPPSKDAKMEMKILNPLHFLCGARLPGGINKNSLIWIGRCLVAMVTALDHVGLSSLLLPKRFTVKK